ncbi:MAG TPA: protein kinase [Vicinamibacterales bacterium]|nr:protein kinase [Vicinamibacterales bacterium]
MTDIRAAGDRIGSYTIVAPIGAGAMGEVYRARDTRLDRDVAIKILPPAFASDPERRARFEREAKTLASLNHPNIGQIYGLEQNALVMELVDGEELAARVTRGPIPVVEALGLAHQIACALDAAHERGIVHRDLKPANIKVRTDGTIKVLDFGLAKMTDARGVPDVDAMTSPTVTSPATGIGLILGTAPYMSPEQALGNPVDKRADIWAFGCVLYEMLTGRRAFPGATSTAVVAAVLERDPEWAALPVSTPPRVHALLRRCLTRNPAQRLRDIGDALPELEARAAGGEDTGARARPWRMLAAASAAGAIVASAGTALFLDGPSGAEDALAAPITFTVEPIGNGVSLAISQDGSTIAWVGPQRQGVSRIWVRRLESPDASEVPGTEGGQAPFLSPDGRAVGFFSFGTLKRVDVATDSIQTLVATPSSFQGGSWSVNDVIVYSDRFGLYQIPAGGGTPTLVAPLDRSRRENSLRHPHFLPDGRRFLYVARSGRPDESSAYLGSLDAPPRRLFASLSEVMFAPPDLLLFVKDGTLFAQRFDLTAVRLEGPPMPVAAGVHAQPLGLNTGFAVSASGALVYAPAAPGTTVTLRWFDRAGRDLGALGQPSPVDQFRIAPDGRRVAFAMADAARGSRSIWIADGTGALGRFTFLDTHDWMPIWSPDGTRIAFASYRNGPLDLYVKDATGAAAEYAVVQSDLQKDSGDWSPDGRFIVYRLTRANGAGDIMAAEVSNPSNVLAVTNTPDLEERLPRFSGDGRWLAYVEVISGRREVIVQPFPPTGGKWQVSVNGGDSPAWTRDGRELIYLDSEGMLQALAVDASAASFAAGPPTPLFRAGPSRGFQHRYDVTRDGSRFLVAVDDPLPPAKPATVVVNWHSMLKGAR